MPTYTYECSKCTHQFKEFQKMTDEPLDECPECGAKVKRLIGSGSGVIFKGTGFYQTDYKKAPQPACGKSDSCSGCAQNG